MHGGRCSKAVFLLRRNGTAENSRNPFFPLQVKP